MSMAAIRAGIIAAGIGLVILILWVILGWRDSARELDGLRQQLQAERAGRARETAMANQASRNFHDELETLRARPAIGPVRLCRTAPERPSGVTPGRTDDPPAAAGVGLQGAQGGSGEGAGVGPDIGPDLDAIAARCDEVTAQLRALHGWEILAEATR